MKTGNTIPDVIFQWLENKSFNALSPSEKEVVSVFLTQEEYDDMHLAVCVMSSGKAERRKGLVMEAFDRHHGLKIRRLSVSWIWKAAAVILPMGLIAGFYFLKQGAALEALAQVRSVDTVYVEKEVVGPKEIIHDTVFYIEKRRSAASRRVRATEMPRADIVATDEMNGLSLEEMRAISNEKKGSSLEEDTTWMSFETVPL